MGSIVPGEPARQPNRRAPARGSLLTAAIAGASAVGLVSTKALATASSELINGLLDGAMSETAYDTAMVSHLRSSRDPSQLAFPATIGWLRRYQHADGSWGGRVEIAHDRIVSTLAAIVRLAELPDEWARLAVQNGVAYLWRRARDWQAGPHETIAFELLVPRFLQDAQQLGLALPFDAFAGVLLMREEKLRRIPEGYLYAKPTTLVHSLEFLGSDIDRRQVRRLRGQNGSYGNSPSATAHVLAQVHDDQAEGYLQRVMGISLNGGACNVYPFEVFERAWVLYNLGLAGIAPSSVRVHLQYLFDSLRPEGLGISREGLIPDSDDTAMVLTVLQRAGYTVSLDSLLPFERDDCFSCFPFERNASISANARVLEALKLGRGRDRNRCSGQIAKIHAYLRDQRLGGRYWQDKWHVSPYYATAQVVTAACGIADDLVAQTQAWLLETQRPDGSWGCYCGTSEETAYAMQALLTLTVKANPATNAALTRGAAYLSQHFDDTDYPELWVGKGLYTPYAVVRSAVISALQLYHHVSSG